MSYYDDYEDYEEDQDQEEFNPENLQEVIEQNQKNEEEEANSQNSAGRNLGKKFSNGRKAAGESIKKAFKEALAKAMKTIAQLLAKALASPYGWIVLAVIVLIIIAVIVVMKLTSDSSIEVSNDFMDSNYEDKDDITPEEKEAYELWKESQSLLLTKLSDVDSIYDKYIEYIKLNKDDSLDDMQRTLGSDEYKEETEVLPTQKRELYKHILMTEKYNFNTIKWKKYSAKGEGASRELSEDEKVSFKNDKKKGLKYPSYENKELSYFVNLVNPYLQSHFIPLSLYSLSVSQNKNGDGKNAEFAYAIIKDAASDITMNIYQLEEYSEVWEHEEFDIENGNIMSGYRCEFAGTKGVEKEVEVGCDGYSNPRQRSACESGAIPKPKVKTTVSEAEYKAVYKGETRESFNTSSSSTAEVLAGSYKNTVYQYKPYEVKTFDVMLEYTYSFIPYNTEGSPDSTSQIEIALDNEEKTNNNNFDVSGRCNVDNQGTYFTVKTGTYQLRKNRRKIQVTKTWRDKLNSTGMTHRQYKLTDVENFVAEKDTSDSEYDFSKKAKKYYEDLVKDFENGSCTSGINRVDMINATPNIYSKYVKNPNDKNISVNKQSLYLNYRTLRDNLKKLEDEDEILPYVYAQTLCLNENYNFDGLYNSACNTYSGSGEYLLPVPSQNLVAFLQGYTPVYTVTHEGVDIWAGAGSNGTDIAATRDGVVYLAEDGGWASGKLVSAGTGNGYGNHIIIKHSNGWYTLYGHLLSGTFKVKTGDTVKAGQIIATMGSSGNSSGTHLHYNISKTPYVFDGSPQDPLEFYNVEPAISKYPAYDKLDKSTVTDKEAYKISVKPSTKSGSSSLDGFLFIGDSRTHGIESELKAAEKNITVKGVDSSVQSEWVNVAKNGSGTVHGENVTLPSADKVNGVSVALGVNAITDTDNMEKLLDALAKRYEGKNIYVNSVFPVASNYSLGSLTASDLNKKIKEFNKKLKEICKNNDNYQYINISSGLTDSNGYLKKEYADNMGVHLTSSTAKKKLVENIKSGILENGTEKESVNLDFLGIGSKIGDPGYQRAYDWFFQTCKKWGDAFGVDPRLTLSKICQESGCGTSRGGVQAAGIMQVEKVSWGTTMTLPFMNGANPSDYGLSSDKVKIDYNRLMSDDDYAIMVGTAIYRQKQMEMEYNIIASLQGYNYGSGGIQRCISYYISKGKGPLNSAFLGVSNEEYKEYLRSNDFGWMEARDWYSDTGYLYFNAGAGDRRYVENVLGFYDPSEGLPYVINDEGEKITLSGDVTGCNSGSDSETATSEGPEGSNVGEGKWKLDEEYDNTSKKISTYTNAKGQKYYLYNQSSYGSSSWTNSGCGQTASAIVISGLMNKNVDPAKMFSPGYTMTSDIISLLNTHGVEVIKHVGEFGDRYNLATSEEDVKYMKQQLSKGNPIIIGINGGTWIKTNGYSAHWMTILGIKDDGSIFVSDPGGAYRDGWVKFNDFGGKYTAQIVTYLVCKKK